MGKTELEKKMEEELERAKRSLAWGEIRNKLAKVIVEEKKKNQDPEISLALKGLFDVIENYSPIFKRRD